MKMKLCKRIAFMLSIVIFLVSVFPQNVLAMTLTEYLEREQEANKIIDYGLDLDRKDYAEVYASSEEKDYQRTGDSIKITAENAINAITSSYKDNESVVMSREEDGNIKFKFNCETSGLYALRVRYCAMNEVTTSIVRSIAIDGEVPFTQSGFVTLYRLWEDDGEPTVNLLGNEVAPGVKQVFEYQTAS